MEPAGPHAIVTVHVQDAALKAVTTLDLRETAAVGVTLPPERAHWFEPVSGRRLE